MPEDYIVPEQVEEEWKQLLADFEVSLYPTFAAKGIPFGMAILLWKIDNLGAEIHQLIEELEDHNGY
jgi:hypothetical protein